MTSNQIRQEIVLMYGGFCSKLIDDFIKAYKRENKPPLTGYDRLLLYVKQNKVIYLFEDVPSVFFNQLWQMIEYDSTIALTDDWTGFYYKPNFI